MLIVMNGKVQRDVMKRIAARLYGAATRYYLNERFVQEEWFQNALLVAHRKLELTLKQISICVYTPKKHHILSECLTL